MGGDVQCRQYGVSAEPEIVCGLSFGPKSALMLASDGVWDMVSKDIVASRVVRMRSQAAAESIVSTSASCWAAKSHMDDITALIVKSTPSTGDNPYFLAALAGA